MLILFAMRILLRTRRWTFMRSACSFTDLPTAESSTADRIGSDGIRGMIKVEPARGALLDNAGRLLGYWFMWAHKVDRMAMPIGIDRLRIFGRRPRLHERIECTVRIRSIDDRSVSADLSLAQGDRTWASIEGWRDRRFETDDRLWNLIQWPEKNLLSDVTLDGFVLYQDRYQTMPTRDRLLRRFLTESERVCYDQNLATAPTRVDRRPNCGQRCGTQPTVAAGVWTDIPGRNCPG